MSNIVVHTLNSKADCYIELILANHRNELKQRTIKRFGIYGTLS